MEATIYNVIIHGVESRISPFGKAFQTIEKANSYAEWVCEERKWTVKSFCTMEDDGDSADFRAEDADGNTFYLVIFKQTITIDLNFLR